MTEFDPPAIPAWLAEQYPFRRRMLAVEGHRLHFVDEGEGRPVLMLHGNPTWSYSWRKVILRLQRTGLRIIAPDLVGLGLSDKPRHTGFHTLEQHARIVKSLIEQLQLQEVTLVGQDWGGPIIAGAVLEIPERISGAVFGNTSLLLPRTPIRTTAFHRFSHLPILGRAYFYATCFPVNKMHTVQGDPARMGDCEKRAYYYPLRRFLDRAAPLALARMVPDCEDHVTMKPLAAIDAWARSFDKPIELVWGLRDPILGRALKRMREAILHARVTETEAGHFLQEEVPDKLADAIARVAML